MLDKIDLLARLGDYIKARPETLHIVVRKTHHNNAWFVPENIYASLDAIADAFLQREKLEKWIEKYDLSGVLPRKIGLVMAGNIPLVGFHDVLCVFAVGHTAQIKLSEKDPYLLPHLIDVLIDFDAQVGSYFEFSERLKGFDAIIATGSNNTSRYFEAYFGKYPHIIRKNRNGVAVLDGRETREELLALGKDIFDYFGLGCRNVSKIYVPKGYVFDHLLEILHEFNEIILNDKYKNNFDYNYALYLLNRLKFLNNGCLILLENPSYASRIAALHYEYYADKEELIETLRSNQDKIQCIASNASLSPLPTVWLGTTQSPALSDYADGIDTMAFLIENK